MASLNEATKGVTVIRQHLFRPECIAATELRSITILRFAQYTDAGLRKLFR